MPDVGVPELLIIAFVVLLLFGPGKAADLGSSLGKGIREFRRETAGDVAHAAPNALPSAAARFCTACGNSCAIDQKFCLECGKPIMVVT
jgi:sec-independent protein translocase protein TatA